MRRFQAAAGMALVASVLIGVPAGGVSTTTPLPPYFDSQVYGFTVFANQHWKLGGSTSAALQFNGNPAASNYGSAVPGGDVAKYMWARRCSTGGQRVEFDRTLWLPGRPKSVEIHARPSLLYQHGRTWSQPFDGVRLLVNGRQEAATNGSSIDLTTSNGGSLAAFHRGTNNVTLIVRKRPNPSYISTCGGNSASSRLGVQLVMMGRGFPVDLGVIPPAADSKVKYYHVQPGGSQAFVITFHAYNNGPSASRAGHLGITIQPGFMQMSEILTDEEEAPFHPCSVNGHNVDCSYNDAWLTPGTSPTVRVLWKVTAPTDEPNTDVEQMLVSWAVRSTNGQSDANSANDNASWTVYFCYPAATAYGCDKN